MARRTGTRLGACLTVFRACLRFRSALARAFGQHTGPALAAPRPAFFIANIAYMHRTAAAGSIKIRRFGGLITPARTFLFGFAACIPISRFPLAGCRITRYTARLCAAVVARLALFRLRPRAFALIGYGACTPFSPRTVGSVARARLRAFPLTSARSRAFPFTAASVRNGTRAPAAPRARGRIARTRLRSAIVTPARLRRRARTLFLFRFPCTFRAAPVVRSRH